MHHQFESIPFSEYATRLDAVCTWFERLGIGYSKTRVGRYKELFTTLAACTARGTPEKFLEIYDFDSWKNAVHESAELMRIHEGLSRLNDGTLITRLKDATRGHELFVLDDEDRSGRDFSFELSVCAKFAKYGYEIDFGHEADVKVVYKGRDLFVECKRLKSQNNISKTLKKGLKQLHKRYSKSDNPSTARGFLAISIGKIINSNLGFVEAKDSSELGNSAFLYNTKFIERYGSYWLTPADKRTLGAVIVLDIPAKISSNNLLTTCHQIAINCGWSRHHENDILLRDIALNALGYERVNEVQ
jgi:hypothetical protein